jgi:hypothetical protein
VDTEDTSRTKGHERDNGSKWLDKKQTTLLTAQEANQRSSETSPLCADV